MSTKPQISNSYKTVLTIVIGFGIVFLITQNKYFLYVTLGIGILGLISSFLAKQIENLWGLLTKLLSYIVPNILLTIIFYLFLFPIALLSRLFSKKDHLKLKKSGESTFVIDERSFEKASFEQTF